jgi:hypothetical protein
MNKSFFEKESLMMFNSSQLLRDKASIDENGESGGNPVYHRVSAALVGRKPQHG